MLNSRSIKNIPITTIIIILLTLLIDEDEEFESDMDVLSLLLPEEFPKETKKIRYAITTNINMINAVGFINIPFI
jgi:hypothetical protein